MTTRCWAGHLLRARSQGGRADSSYRAARASGRQSFPGSRPAVIHGEAEAIACLLRLGAQHTLMSAAALGDEAALKRLAEKNVSSRERMDAALAAARYGRIASVETLLEGGLGISERMTSHPYAPTLLHQGGFVRPEGIGRMADRTWSRPDDSGYAAQRNSGWMGEYGERPEHAEWFAEQEAKASKSTPLEILKQVAAEISADLEKKYRIRCETGGVAQFVRSQTAKTELDRRSRARGIFLGLARCRGSQERLLQLQHPRPEAAAAAGIFPERR